MANSQQTPANLPEAPAAEMPLFFRAPRLLENTRHASATILPTADYSFASAVNSIPVNALEFIEAVKYYPIVFTLGDAPIPVAIVGLEQNNLYIDDKGQWAADHYIPAYVRQYPFIFMERPDDNKFYLCVDEDAMQYNAGNVEGGQPLYNADGSASELSNHALQFCTQYYQHRTITQNFCADLVKHKLLSPYQTECKTASGRTVQLTGFQMIDEKAFNALDEETFKSFREKGWLPLVYLSLAATSNWARIANRLTA